MNLCCIEPYPRPFLKNGIDGLSDLLVSPVEAVPLTLFESLQADDFFVY